MIIEKIVTGRYNQGLELILIDIDGKNNFSICAQSDRKIIQKFWSLENEVTQAIGKIEPPDFVSC